MQLLSVDELLEGMILSKTVLAENGTEILKIGSKLKDAVILALKKRGIKEVYVNDRYTLDVNPLDVISKELKKLLSDEILKLAPAIKEANMNDEMQEISRTALEIVSKTIENENVLKLCLNMKILDGEKFYKHAITTCALSLLLASALKIDIRQIYLIGIAALLHDIGVCEMPHLVKRKAITPQEEAQWKEHAMYGYYLVQEAGIREDIAKMILHHHEHWQGDGFPDGKKEEEIPIGARIIAVCQTYDYLIRYENQMPYEAIEYLYGAGNYFFDAKITQAFTENIAVYPLTSMVRLTNGEVGVVINIRQNKGPRPVLKIFYDAFNKPYANPKELDLGKERTIFIKEIL